MSPKLPRPVFIRSTSELQHHVERWRTEPLLAVDTESNSLYAYYERVCLVQLSTREQDFIIDPLAVNDMSAFGELLADPQIEIIFHAAEYDVISLKRDFEFEFANIFDTMLAARICGWKKIGLGNILESQFGVRAQKKFQRANWTRRPLPPEQLHYAQMDTHFLPELRDRLRAELEEHGRLVEARETFAELPKLPPAEYHFDTEGYWRIQAVRNLSRQQIAIARELYLTRDSIARRKDRPHFKVFGDHTLVRLAELAPRRIEDLYNVKGLSSQLVRTDGAALLDAVAQGRQASPPQPPQRRPPTDPDVLERYEALKSWRKGRAQQRGVESDVILARDTLWILARKVPSTLDELDTIPGLGPWRRAEYGEELLDVLAHANGGAS